MKFNRILGVVLALSLTPSIVLANPNSKLQVIDDGDWRSADPDIPWSVPVIVRDDFDGDYLAVFDRNFSGSVFWAGHESGVISNWSQQYIRVYVYEITQDCGFLTCSDDTKTLETKSLDIKVGNQVFKLRGEDGNFPVSSELATALKNAPPGQAKIRISVEGSGATISSDIGKGTVQAWKTVYKEANSSNQEYNSYLEDVLLYGR